MSLSMLKKVMYHHTLSLPYISFGLTALSLLPLVLVLLSVPGPIKGLYWFSVKDEAGESTSAGVLGWCMTTTSNCTYAPLSENPYLSTLIDTGTALLVRTMVPLACYWMIVTFLLWIGLAVLTPIGYKIKDLDSITRHLRFTIIEACVLCMSLFGNVLSWLAFGLCRNAFRTVEKAGGEPESGQVMETTAAAAFISLLSLFTAVWGLHLRLCAAQAQWKEEAVMLRRRSMALCANGFLGPEDDATSTLGRRDSFLNVGPAAGLGGGEKRWSTASAMGMDMSTSTLAPEYSLSEGNGARLQQRGSLVKAGYHPEHQSRSNSRTTSRVRGEDEEEHLDVQFEEAKRNSIDMVRRNSLHDGPYAAAHQAPN